MARCVKPPQSREKLEAMIQPITYQTEVPQEEENEIVRTVKSFIVRKMKRIYQQTLDALRGSSLLPGPQPSANSNNKVQNHLGSHYETSGDGGLVCSTWIQGLSSREHVQRSLRASKEESFRLFPRAEVAEARSGRSFHARGPLVKGGRPLLRPPPASAVRPSAPPPRAGPERPPGVRPLEGVQVWLELGVVASAPPRVGAHPPSSPSLALAGASPEPDGGAVQAGRASFPRSWETVGEEEGGRAGRKEGGERGRGGGGRRGRGRGSRPGDLGAPGAGLDAAGSLGRSRLHRAARGKEMARLAAGCRPGAPRAPLPRGGRPRVRRRHGRRCSPGEGQSGQRPREEGRGRGGAALAPGSAPAPADSQPSFFPSPAPTPGRRGGGCSPLCNRGVKKSESARGNITSDEMTMIKISFFPAPSRARRRPGRRVAGRRGAGGWAAEGAGAWAHRSREGPGRGPGGKARAPGETGGDRPAKGRETAHFVAERGRRGRAELIATLILCPAAQPSPEPGVAARSRSRSPRWVIWSRIAALCVRARPRRGAGCRLGWGAGFLASNRGGPLEREEGGEVGAAGGQQESGAKRRRRRRRPRGGEEARGGRGGEAPARRAARGRGKRGPGREGWDETGATRAASTGGEAAPGARDRRLRGAGAAPEPDLPLRLRGKPRAGGHRSAPRTPVPKVAEMLRKSPGRGSDLGGGGCFVPVLGGGGWRHGGTQHKGLAREGGLPTWAGPGPGWTVLTWAGARASCRAGRGVCGGVGVAGPDTGASVQGRAPCRAGEFPGSELGSRSCGFGADRARLGAQIREKKSLTGQMCVL
ncbi:hypothetical protein HPG69_012518 [Diceros bicornis minor]|uniref:Uncharacterized protein n=1 Tax=Diceros bicornis minor TaxID=77932 RepID=A0A7J7F8B5_DICBM|nr:hypothetical protein HPG69_012518 [Diceros bicornis minor]